LREIVNVRKPAPDGADQFAVGTGFGPFDVWPGLAAGGDQVRQAVPTAEIGDEFPAAGGFAVLAQAVKVYAQVEAEGL